MLGIIGVGHLGRLLRGSNTPSAALRYAATPLSERGIIALRRLALWGVSGGAGLGRLTWAIFFRGRVVIGDGTN